MKSEKMAEKMFEKLGYTKDKKSSDEFGLYYKKEYYVIAFYLKGGRYVHCYEWTDIDNGKSDSFTLSIEELLAIMQQCKELGWLDNTQIIKGR